MEIKKNINGESCEIALVGRLDTSTAPELEAVLQEVLPTIKKLDFDFSELDYLSSAGLRVLLNSQKVMSKQGVMVIHHPNDTVMDVFDMTGFSSILTIGLIYIVITIMNDSSIVRTITILQSLSLLFQVFDSIEDLY